MNVIRQSWAIGGSLLFAAASGLVASGDDSAAPVRDAEAVEQPTLELLPEPLGDVVATPIPVTATHCPPAFGPQYCPPGRFARFKQRCQAKYWGYPEEFCEPPLGAMVQGFQMIQIANAQAARMGLYQYDFLPDSDQLNTRGKAQLARIGACLPMNGFPIFIDPTPSNPELDELRRQAAWRELALQHGPIPIERIVIGRPNIRGLDAPDALVIDRNRLGLTSSRGVGAGGGGASAGSTILGGSQGANNGGN
jgi:hypothetical protein